MKQHAQQYHDTQINKPMAFKAGRTEEKGRGTKIHFKPFTFNNPST